MLYPQRTVSLVTRRGPVTGVTTNILCTSINTASKYGNLEIEDTSVCLVLFITEYCQSRRWKMQYDIKIFGFKVIGVNAFAVLHVFTHKFQGKKK